MSVNKYNGTELINIAGKGQSITVDDALSDTSTNPVQNKVIKTALDEKDTAIANVAQKVSNNDDAYSSIKAYAVGDLVIYDNKLYRCITACSAGSWATNQSCFTADTLTSAVNVLNKDLVKGIDFTNGTILSNNTVLPSDGLVVVSISYVNGGYVYVSINGVYVFMGSKNANTYGIAQNFSCYKGQRIYIETNISQRNLVTFYPAF